MALSSSETLDTEALSCLFDHTTNSYKYLFFLGLLDVLRQQQFDSATPIVLKDVVVEMLVRAWKAHHEHHLKFGTQDQIAGKLEELDRALPNSLFRVRDVSPSDLRGMVRGRVDDSTVELLRYVPFRLIRPFFAAELQGSKDAQVNSKILRLTQETFETRKPLYRFSDDLQSIELHPEWSAYLRQHDTQVQQWAFMAWVEYMERCNPQVPDLDRKLPLALYGLLLTLHSATYYPHLAQVVRLFEAHWAS